MLKSKSVVRCSSIMGLALFGTSLALASAQAPPAGPAVQQTPGPGGQGRGGGRGLPGGGIFGPGFNVQQTFQQRCSSCHTAEGTNIGDRVAPSVTALRDLPAERVYQAIATGTMAVQANGIVDRDKRTLAAFAAGKPFNTDPEAFGIAKMANVCTSNPPLGNITASPSWLGWSATSNNARFQTAAAAKLTAADTPKLKLKWAFGVPGAGVMSGQPTVAFGRVFFGSDNNMVYSIDAKSGCAYWAYNAGSAGRFAPVIGSISGHLGITHALYFATGGANVYAVNAQDGKEIWRASFPNRVTDANGRTRELNNVSASVAYHDGRIYVPLAGTETFYTPASECCRSRGGLLAIDANTGKLVWRSEVIPEPATRTGTTASGVPVWGESGASVWNTPTIDAKRQRVYVGTGNSYGPVAADTSDSIIAFDMKTGKMLWHHQEFRNDSFMASFGGGGCAETNAPGGACPEKMGPDWDFGGSSAILQTMSNGKDVILAAGKGGVAIALDPDANGKVVWRTQLWEKQAPTALGLVLWGGSSDGQRVYYALQQPDGGLKALKLSDGTMDWNAEVKADRRGQSGAVSSIPGLVFTGGWDGILRAVDNAGEVVWTFNTNTDFRTVNGISGKGGSLGVAGAAIADGMLYIPSGYTGVNSGTGGNVLLAFGIE